MIEWVWRERAWAAMEDGRVRAVVSQRVTKDAWNLHLHELPYERGVFRYRTPEAAKKHAMRWFERHPAPSTAEIRRRTDLLFPSAPKAPSREPNKVAPGLYSGRPPSLRDVYLP